MHNTVTNVLKQGHVNPRKPFWQAITVDTIPSEPIGLGR